MKQDRAVNSFPSRQGEHPFMGERSVNPPRTAYVLLWFPKPSETFIFREVVNLRAMGMPLEVFALYDELTEDMSDEMREASGDVERIGLKGLKRAVSDWFYWLKRDRKATLHILREALFRRWKGLEKSGESLWAVLCAATLARRFVPMGIAHIHAPWASGPATAAWVASRLTGIPFSFTARAWDIYPPDAALQDKLRDAAFVRSETRRNIDYLKGMCTWDAGKIHLTYNGVPLTEFEEAPVHMRPPYKLLALGRFVGKKGYDYLLRACKLLGDSGLDVHLTLAGAGPREKRLKDLSNRLGISERVSFPGFVQYDRISSLFRDADVFVMPSVIDSSGDRDGIPTVIMEALLHRVPVIATNVSGISEVIQDGSTGLLIPEKDASAIASAVKRMVEDRNRALLTAELGKERVLEQFNPEKNHRRVFDLYVELVPGSINSRNPR
ncbi:MAG: glycosyltransferase [Desulfomonilaceae bacterium]|nr:glycosyltransferase [Desulfomonilaceae bacterium]